MDCCQTSNPNARCLNGEDFCNWTAGKEFLEDFPQFADKRNIDLMIQEAVHLEDIPTLDDTVSENLFCSKFNSAMTYPFPIIKTRLCKVALYHKVPPRGTLPSQNTGSFCF